MFGTIERLPSKRYRAYYKHEGRRVYAQGTFRHQGRRQRLAGQHRDRPWTGHLGDPHRGQETFQQYAGTWMKRTDLADSTRGKYEGLLRSHILPTFGKVELRRLAGAASTVRSGTTSSTSGTRTAPPQMTPTVASGVRNTPCGQPYEQVPLHSQGRRMTEATERPVAALAELDAAVAAIATRYKAGYAIAAWCQLRRGEILGLRRMDIDVKREQLQVRLNWVMPPGATRPVLTEPKSEAGKRPVAIPSHVMPLVEPHLERYVGPEPTAWLYGAKNGQPMLPRNFYRAWQKARKAVGRPDLTLHDLRHTGLTWSAATGRQFENSCVAVVTPALAPRSDYQRAAEESNRALADALSKMAAAASS